MIVPCMRSRRNGNAVIWPQAQPASMWVKPSASSSATVRSVMAALMTRVRPRAQGYAKAGLAAERNREKIASKAMNGAGDAARARSTLFADVGRLASPHRRKRHALAASRKGRR